MRPDDWLTRVRDMLDAIERIRGYVEGLDLAGFEADERTVDAVVYRFAVLGEAARAVPEEKRARYSGIPWRDASSMRNVLVHEYLGVRTETVWQTIVEDLPGLAEKLRGLLESEGEAPLCDRGARKARKAPVSEA